MKYFFKNYFVVLVLVVASCSTVETCILPSFYTKTILNEDKSIYPYFFNVYSLDVDEISMDKLKEFPKCDFKKLYSRDYLVDKWTSFDNIDKNSKYLMNHLSSLNKESNNDPMITELNKNALIDQSNFIFAGFYTNNNTSKVTTKSYDFFYILDKKKKILYEFSVEE